MSWMKMIGAVAPDTSQPVPRPPGLVAFMVPLAAFAALEAFAYSQGDPAARAETSFLAFLLAGTLAAIATASQRPARELAWTALLVVTTAWIVDYGPHRTAVVSVLLVSGLVMTLYRWWGTPGNALPLRVPLAAIFGLQLLARPELALSPNPGTLLDLLLVPLISGWALALIGRTAGAHRALMVALVSGVFLPGWNLTVALVLVALALAAKFGRRRYLVLGAIVLLLLWNPLAALLIGLTMMALLERPRRAPWLTAWLVLLAAFAWWQGRMDPVAAIEAWSQGLILLPGIVLIERGNRWQALSGALCALLITLVSNVTTLPPGLETAGWIVVALALPRSGIQAEWQRLWGLLCGLWAVLLAASPWRRPAPLAWLLDHLALTPLTGALWAIGLFLLAVVICRTARRRGAGQRLPAFLILTVLALVGLLLVPPTAALPVSYQAVRLDHNRPRWSRALKVAKIESLVIDSNLIHGVELEAGTPVAKVELIARGGKVVENWHLLAGDHTAEWAAARPDIAALPNLAAPPAWLSQVAVDRTFFAQRYRATWRFEAAQDIERVTLWRHAELPKDVVIMIYRMELRH